MCRDLTRLYLGLAHFSKIASDWIAVGVKTSSRVPARFDDVENLCCLSSESFPASPFTEELVDGCWLMLRFCNGLIFPHSYYSYSGWWTMSQAYNKQKNKNPFGRTERSRLHLKSNWWQKLHSELQRIFFLYIYIWKVSLFSAVKTCLLMLEEQRGTQGREVNASVPQRRATENPTSQMHW